MSRRDISKTDIFVKIILFLQKLFYIRKKLKN